MALALFGPAALLVMLVAIIVGTRPLAQALLIPTGFMMFLYVIFWVVGFLRSQGGLNTIFWYGVLFYSLPMLLFSLGFSAVGVGLRRFFRFTVGI